MFFLIVCYQPNKIFLIPGAYPIFAFPRVLIDISGVTQLKQHVLDQNLTIGAGSSLTDVMDMFKAVAEKYEEFEYLNILYEHIDLVAHIPVRNVSYLKIVRSLKK